MKRILSLIIILLSTITYCYSDNGVYEKLQSKYDVVIDKSQDFGFYKLIKGDMTKDHLEGIADTQGKIIIPVKYSVVLYQEKEDIFIVGYGAKRNENSDLQGGKWGLLAKDGKELTPLKYSRLYSFEWSPGKIQTVNVGGKYSNQFKMVVGGKYGLLNAKGEEIVPCKYDWIYPVITEGLAVVNIGGKRVQKGQGSQVVGGKWGCVDLKGNIIIPVEYDENFVWNAGAARTKKDGKLALVKNPLKENIAVNIAGNSPSVKKSGQAVSRYPAPNSDVDKNIPVGRHKNEDTFAFIIANENYPDAPVPYSLNDGRIFKEYCQKTLGIPEKNVNLYEDATFGTIIGAVEKMKSIADAYDGDASVIFYYAGHGFPDEKNSTAYLLPVDGSASDITTTGYSLAKLYSEISKLKLKKTLVLLDACFSGAKREDKMLASSRGVAIKVKDETPQGNMVVFSAAEGDETAHQLEEKGHGLFTYYLLKELQQTDGNVSLGELTDFVTKQVKRQSVVINNKKQTPTVIPSSSLAGSWRSIKL